MLTKADEGGRGGKLDRSQSFSISYFVILTVKLARLG